MDGKPVQISDSVSFPDHKKKRQPIFKKKKKTIFLFTELSEGILQIVETGVGSVGFGIF